MNLAGITLIPLLSGYLFAVLFPPSSYYAAREEGHKLYFRAAFYGTFLFLCSIFLNTILSNYFPKITLAIWNYVFYFVSQSLGEYIKNEKEVTSLILLNFWCLSLAMFFGAVFNTNKRFKFFIYQKAIQYDDIEIIITRAVKDCMPISISMKNRKVYVGFVNNTIDPKEDRKDIRILPLLSGYREKEENKIIFTTNYYSIYDSKDNHIQHLAPETFEIAFPLSEVQSLNLFDIDVYNKFNETCPQNQLDFGF
ncbi:MAG: hypothetical protein AB7D06_14805 [Pedobacter sp.]